MKKIRGKKAAAAVVLVLILLCAVCIGMALYYNVRADNSNLAERALQYLDRKTETPAGEEIRVYHSIDLGDRRYVLIEYEPSDAAQLGIVRLKKGLNGRYRIDRISWSSGNFQEEVVEANYQKYYLLGGRNASFDLAEVKIVLEGRKYDLEIPEGDHFLVCEEIDYTIRDTHSDLNRLKFYSSSGEDVTSQVPWD